MTKEDRYKVPFAAGLHRDSSIRVYVDEIDTGMRIIRGDAWTGIMIEVPTPLKAMDAKPDIVAIKAAWLKWKADDTTAWMAMTEIGAILEGKTT